MRWGGSVVDGLRAWRLATSLAFSTWPSGAAGRLAVAAVSQVSRGLVPALALQQVVDAAEAGRASAAVGWMVVLALSGLTPGLDALWEYFQRGLMMRGFQASVQMTMAATLAPAGIDHLESPHFADQVESIKTHRNALPLLFDWMATMAGILLSLAASLVVLAAVDPRLLVPVAGAAVMGLFQAGARRRALVFFERSLPGQRLAGRLAELGTSPLAAKEIRMLGLGGWLVQRHSGLTSDVARRLLASERGPALAAAGSGVAEALMLAAGVAFLVRLVATGQASPGELALGIVLLQAALTQAGGLGGLGADLAKNTYGAQRLLWLMNHVPDVVAPANPLPVPPRLHRGIVVDHVHFAYSGARRPALDDVCLTLPAGATVALVGDNGAGKSTLVKLLCRFYDPNAGTITVDGVDLRELDLDAWRAASTGAFQDFVRFHVLARESVGSGDLNFIQNQVRVRTAAAAGGSATFLEALADGYESQLGREFGEGADLSEGQWQKVALSRGLMRAEPLLVILDEPTAALDARAEYGLFERYAAEAKSGRARGAVTLLVSHRFSTVRMADRIVVLEGGRVAESGTHAELLARQGSYAELYTLQVDAYR